MKKKIKIIISGCKGRMGKKLLLEIKKSKYFELIGLTDKNPEGKINNIKINTNNSDLIKKTDIIIDFSRPMASIELINIAKKFKKKVVIGTTGFNERQEKQIKKVSKSIAIFKSGNMSLGINFIEYLTYILSKKIPNDYQVNITDNHHKKKIDYPSGTALMLAKAAALGKNKTLKSLKGKTFLNKKGNIKKNKINFFITRKGNTIGKHSVHFSNKTENIELKHVAFSRQIFAEGALTAAKWISKKDKGLFNMQDMFNIK
ncbi:MAG: 4-hydroxy-tetrahydrodipicolinate reductase [Pelagibacteraceae bacterium]|nr:MAG: 4-hydroxy-tetrahydrodipicolinate reductase [Pelagibacteraceae bacterium]